MARDLDVVIVAFGNGRRIAECVTRACGLAAVRDVVVVDHGDDDGAHAAEAAGARVLVDRTNPGFGAGQNRGIAATRAPFVLLLNPDAEIAAEGVDAGLELLAHRPEVAAVQGVIVNRGTGEPERSQGRELAPLHLLGRALGAKRLLAFTPVRAILRRTAVLEDHVTRGPTQPIEVPSLAATALLLRRTAFDAIGGFDARYFLYGEDLDLCRRLRIAGWRLVALPDRFAVHDGGASSGGWTAREMSWWRGTMRFAASWWSTPAWCLAVAAACLAWAKMSLQSPGCRGMAWRALVTGPIADRRKLR